MSHRDTKQSKAQEKGQETDELQQKKVKTEEDPYKDIRLGGIMARTHNWWEEGDDAEDEEAEQANDRDWKYMEHHGVLFPAFYQRHNVPILYEGKELKLTDVQEEMCTYWAQSMGTDWETKEDYRNNFTEQFRTKCNFPTFSLDKCDFTLIKRHLEAQRDLRLSRPQEVKLREKLEKELKDRIYGYALVDGCLERLGSYTLEPPTLFKGRGDHPRMGLLKARQYPEDLTLNVSEMAPVPRCTMPGHSWGNIVNRPDVTWLVSYVDSSVRKDNHKYVQFAATSRFKQMNDKKKYNKARRLKNCIERVREDYMKKLRSESTKQRQVGTATYLIDKLALRVGNEKDEDEADTVGCCSLRVQHITVLENNRVILDFLGKDSMRYHNEVELDPQVCQNLLAFQKGKTQDNNLFHEIQTDDLNEYLKTQMKGLTAKVFRTYNASHTLQQELERNKHVLLRVDDLQKKVDYYDEANKQVAILCNHQKTIPKSFEITKQKITYRIQLYKDYVVELKNNAKSRDPKEFDEEVDAEPPGVELKKGKKKATFVKKFFSTKERNLQQIQRVEAKINKEEATMLKKEENKEIALGTSKTNYNDPRISVAWCKEHDVPIERVFPKTLRGKFIWAMSTDPSWKF